jgi:hypothetical protein
MHFVSGLMLFQDVEQVVRGTNRFIVEGNNHITEAKAVRLIAPRGAEACLSGGAVRFHVGNKYAV